MRCEASGSSTVTVLAAYLSKIMPFCHTSTNSPYRVIVTVRLAHTMCSFCRVRISRNVEVSSDIALQWTFQSAVSSEICCLVLSLVRLGVSHSDVPSVVNSGARVDPMVCLCRPVVSYSCRCRMFFLLWIPPSACHSNKAQSQTQKCWYDTR